jgi:phosphoesterase RecJ-like protein
MQYPSQAIRTNVKQLVDRINSAKSILLTTHKQCDGDGLGAMLGLYHSLKKRDKKVKVISVDEIPSRYSFLEPERFISIYEGNEDKQIEEMDLCLIFDTNDRRLVEPLYSVLEEKIKHILFIDHHPVLAQGPIPTAGSFIDTRAASTGEIAYYIIKEMGIRLDEQIARAFYTSIAFDTQLFRYVRNSSSSHLIAADLLEHLKNSETIHRNLFATHTIEKVQFLSKVLGEIEYFGEGQIAVLKLHAKDLLDHNLDMDDSRDVIDMIMNVNTLESAALFREDAKNEYKVSLRSKGKIEVLSIAEAFDGGGHLYAAGASVKGQFADLKQKLVDMLLNRLDPKNAS